LAIRQGRGLIDASLVNESDFISSVNNVELSARKAPDAKAGACGAHAGHASLLRARQVRR